MAPQTRVPGVTVPHVAVPHVAAPDVSAPDLHIPNPLKPVGDVWKALFEADTWIRVSEVGLGILIIGVGLMGLSKSGTAAVKLATPQGKKQFAASIGRAAR